MGFGFSKSFVIFLFISIIIGIGTENWKNGLYLISLYAITKIIWNILTK